MTTRHRHHRHHLDYAPDDRSPPSRGGRRWDPRDMKSASVVSDLNGYYDSQNIVCVRDLTLGGRRVFSCVLHRTDNHEGGNGLALYHTRSVDGGRTWSRLTPIEEPDDGSAIPSTDEVRKQSHDGYQLVIGDRIYVIYGWNKGAQLDDGVDYNDNNGGRRAHKYKVLSRTDMQAERGFWIKWSDDYGVSFGRERVSIPVRRTGIDSRNPWGGRIIGAFACDKPSVMDIGGGGGGNEYEKVVMFAFQKTRDGNGESYGSEVFFLRSFDFAARHDETMSMSGAEGQDCSAVASVLGRATWETLPRGGDNPGGYEGGLQTRRGLFLGEEPHVVQIRRGHPDLLCVWRTELGFIDSATSADFGDSWDHRGDPRPLLYGRRGCVPRERTDNGVGSSMAAEDMELMRLLHRPHVPPGHYLGTEEEAIQEKFRANAERYVRASAEYRRLIYTNQSVIRNPRGAITPFRMRDGTTGLIYYNNGRTDRLGYVGRTVAWLTVGYPAAAITAHSSSSPPSSSSLGMEWTQPEICLWWDGVLLDDREDWNEDWAIVDGPGYADFAEDVESGDGVFMVESNKLAVRFHRLDHDVLRALKAQATLRDLPGDFVFRYERAGYGDDGKTRSVSTTSTSTTVVEGRAYVWKDAPASSSGIDLETRGRDCVVYSSVTAETSQHLSSVGADRPKLFRSSVLPDLRSGRGFSLLCWIDEEVMTQCIASHRSSSGACFGLISGLTVASSALDNEGGGTDDGSSSKISKGFSISYEGGCIQIRITDGFRAKFEFSIPFGCTYDSYYAVDDQSVWDGSTPGRRRKENLFAFVFDGGPKVATCVVNEKLYNGAPCGWRFLPKDLGEIGGSDVEITNECVSRFLIYDRALLTSECIGASRYFRHHGDTSSKL